MTAEDAALLSRGGAALRESTAVLSSSGTSVMAHLRHAAMSAFVPLLRDERTARGSN
jgi:hypothetical protein